MEGHRRALQDKLDRPLQPVATLSRRREPLGGRGRERIASMDGDIVFGAALAVIPKPARAAFRRPGDQTCVRWLAARLGRFTSSTRVPPSWRKRVKGAP
jgi:hypothetical protein